MTNKVALCFLISGEHILNHEQAWKDWIEPNKDFINIYFHYTDYSKIKSEWVRSHAIPSKATMTTHYFHVIPAYLTLIRNAILSDGLNKWFCFLTDSCAPVIPPYQFKHMFDNYSDKSIFKWKKAHWNPLFIKRANLKYLPEDYRLCHDPWFTLTRIDAELCLRFAVEHTNKFKLICAGIIANESLFAIILKAYGRLPLVLNETTYITDWTRMTSANSPYVFTNPLSDQDIEFITDMKKKNKYIMFIRKIRFSATTGHHLHNLHNLHNLHSLSKVES